MSNKKIKFSWDIHYKCDFRCPYCWFYKEWAVMSNRSLYLSPDEWMIHWKKVYDKYGEVEIEITGGEPFIYPHFIELVEKLSAIHLVKIITNLSGDIEHFVKEVSPERVTLEIGCHILFLDIEVVIEKALILKNSGFELVVCYVAYPPQMTMINRVAKRLHEVGINFMLTAFWGEHNCKKYPESYTQEEKDMMRPYFAGVDIAGNFNVTSPEGKACNAGYKYANIRSSGAVVRCRFLGDKAKLGHIMNSDFTLSDSPFPCAAPDCVCNEYNTIIDADSNSNDMPINSPQDSIEINQGIESDDNHRETSVYEISFTWDIHYACNYRCSYCFFAGQWDTLSKKNRYVGIDEWKNIWSDIYGKYGKCHIHITGGEPFMYPRFLDLINFLSKRCSLEFDTNLSFETVNFLNAVGPVKTTFNASYHPEFSNFDLFFEKVIILKKNNHEVSINYVAHPAFLESAEQYRKICVESGINFRMMPFKGIYNGIMYPANYNQREQKIVYMSTTDNSTKEMNEWYDSKNIYNAKEVNMERICHLGHIYAKIHPDGNAYRCCIAQDEGKLGNLIDRTFSLFNKPKICKYDRCSCWRSPLIGEEKRWENFWKKAKS